MDSITARTSTTPLTAAQRTWVTAIATAVTLLLVILLAMAG
jgi:CHASE3 domain sensor protein